MEQLELLISPDIPVIGEEPEATFTDYLGYKHPQSEQDEYVLVGDEYYPEDSEDIILIDNEWYLKDSDEVSFCDKCQEYVLSENTVTIHGDRRINRMCDDCRERYEYYSCAGCGEYYYIDNLYSNDGDCDSYCDSCFVREDEEPDPFRVNNYSTDVADALGFVGASKLKLGIELEVEMRNGFSKHSVSQDVAKAIKDMALMKEDGSISNGFEIVTAPMDFRTQRAFWESFFAANIEGMKSFNTTTCGMHVHISRLPLSASVQSRLSEFINKTYNKAFIKFIAQRSEEQWCKYWPNKKAASSLSRYEALNFQTSTGATIEFRIFKGNLKPESFYKNMEFVVAAVSFCSRISEHPKLSYIAFMQFVSRNRTRFPNLWEFAKGYYKNIDFSQTDEG